MCVSLGGGEWVGAWCLGEAASALEFSGIFCLAADGRDVLSDLLFCALMAGGAWGGFCRGSAQTGLLTATKADASLPRPRTVLS